MTDDIQGPTDSYFNEQYNDTGLTNVNPDDSLSPTLDTPTAPMADINQFKSDSSRILSSEQVTVFELQKQRDIVQSETNFRWLQLVLFAFIILGIVGFWIYQRTTIESNYSTFVTFIDSLRRNGTYSGPGTGYDWAWYFKYPRLAFVMPNINLPAAVMFGWYNDVIQQEMTTNLYCVQEMYIMAQNRPQATAAQILCTWYMLSSGQSDPKICQSLCPPTDPYMLADFLNSTLNTTIQLTAASAEMSGGNPAVIGVTFVGSLILGMSQAKNQANQSATDCESTQRNCISHYTGSVSDCGLFS